MDVRNKVYEVQLALQRAKRKISHLENELSEKESCSESEEELRPVSRSPSRELQESLVDMYKANPRVNEELKQRLPSPVKARSAERPAAPLRLKANTSHVESEAASGAAVEVLTDAPQKLPAVSIHPHPDSSVEALKMMSEKDKRSTHVDDLTARMETRDPGGDTRDITLTRSAGEDQSKTSASNPAPLHVATPDKEKNVAFLLKELDSLRELNRKLRDKLVAKEKELEAKAVDAEMKESVLEARMCEKAGALVEEIYTAQRERDQALMARLRLANEERDEALLRAKRLKQAAHELENINPEEYDTDLEELLNRINIADSAQGIERNGAVIVDRLQKARERRRKITAEEMNAVIEERDATVAKCKRLEQDLHQAKEQSRASANNSGHLTDENNQERAWKELEVVKRERDQVLEQKRKLEENLALRAYSLHQSGDQCDTPGGSQQRQKKLELLASELERVQTQLQLEHDAKMEANEKVQKLERLVDVLRKKVGAGSVRTVI